MGAIQGEWQTCCLKWNLHLQRECATEYQLLGWEQHHSKLIAFILFIAACGFPGGIQLAIMENKMLDQVASKFGSSWLFLCPAV